MEIIKNNIKSINFIFLILLILLLLLRPYRSVFFDTEPTYLAEALHILQWNIPWTSHHPGTLVSYFYSIILKLSLIYKLDIETTVLTLRFLNILILLLIIFLSVYFYYDKKKIFFKYVLLSILTLPIVNIHLGHFGNETFVLAFSFLIWLCLLKLKEVEISKINLFTVSIFIGIASTIKFSIIFFTFILFFLIYIQKNNILKKILLSIYSLFIIFFTFLLLTLPAVRYYPKLFNKINREINIDYILSNNLIIIFIIIFFFLAFIYNNFFSKFLNKFKDQIFYVLLPVFFILLILINYFYNYYYSPYEHLGRFYYTIPTLRNLIVLVPLIVITLYKINFKFSNFIFFLLIIVNIFITLLFSYEKSKIDIVVESKQSDKFVVIASSNFNSKYIFLDFANKRYGNGSIKFPQNWNENNNLVIIESDTFKAWLDQIGITTEINNDSSIIKDDSFFRKIRSNFTKYFRSIDYTDNKFKILSLDRPHYKHRIIQSNYCDQINNKNIIFDVENKRNYNNFIYFEKNIDKIKNVCNFSNIKISNTNHLKVFYIF